jgi:glutamate dehydrogenase/leucine dehydrogenase
VNFFEGSFITGEDVGMTEDDVQVMLEESHYFIGKRGVAGDPSPYAARSVFATMQVAFEAVFGSSNFSNRTFAVKGVGKVGSNLVDLLMKTGAKIFVADIRKEVVDGIKTKHPSIEVVSSEEIHRSPVDVFSPCALGNDISEENAGQIKAKIVCGGANNQLASSVAGTLLSQRNILYVPDYVANAGGLINVVDELEKGGYSKSRVLERIERLKTTLRTILQTSEEKHESSAIVADHFAEHLFKHAVAQPTLVG